MNKARHKETIGLDDCIVRYEVSEEVKEEIFRKLLSFYIDCECFCGEGLCQSDRANIEAIECITEIADDIIKFEAEYL